jgi:hypothetical protein
MKDAERVADRVAGNAAISMLVTPGPESQGRIADDRGGAAVRAEFVKQYHGIAYGRGFVTLPVKRSKREACGASATHPDHSFVAGFLCVTCPREFHFDCCCHCIVYHCSSLLCLFHDARDHTLHMRSLTGDGRHA